MVQPDVLSTDLQVRVWGKSMRWEDFYVYQGWTHNEVDESIAIEDPRDVGVTFAWAI